MPIQDNLKTTLRSEIQWIVRSIQPFDHQEKEHRAFVETWLYSDAEIFRIAKPATPNPHLVSYFLLVDQTANQVLLVDHKKADLWLPPGGHVEPNEHPKETVKREVIEELGIEADFLSHDPQFITVAQTTGKDSHTDVSLWYVLKGRNTGDFKYDTSEFHKIQWFSPRSIPYQHSDPHLPRCLQKLTALKIMKRSP